jgi:ABC-type cobalamin transport system ATPase subunit
MAPPRGSVTKAVTPLIQDMAVLRADVDKLKTAGNQLSGARMIGVWLAQTFFAIVAAVAAVKAMIR